jgi:two-component system, OmpR family, sensor histidine kinase KdpD
MHQRPNPDQLLKHVQADEEIAGRGRLKLFFGASPGVGKTYAMLEAARQRKKEGWDVVIGLAETHSRAETEALLEGFEILPRKEISYKGVVLKEFDLDGALARRPRLIVVDELAHSNAEGLRHAKRWQDVEELLDAGVDVYTTLNVQHWETLNDVVAQITGVTVRETVPDTFLQRVHELELVDLAAEDLLTRLREGKVYKNELAGRAAENFFQPGNLIALRELALRHAAERVDAQMQAFKERHSISDVWQVGERLLVGISQSPMSARLIRAASRMATRLRANWIAVLVETPAFLQLSADERARAINNLRMAEKLGAETVTLSGNDITDEIISFARSRNVTRIILGKPASPRWKEWLFGSVVTDMARRCGNIDLHIISGVGTEFSDRRPVANATPADWAGVGQATAVVGLATLVCWPLFHTLPLVNIVMVYLLGIMFASYRFGRKASILASILSVFAFDFFFVPPYLTFAVSDNQYVLTFVIMLGTGLLISTITGRLRLQTEASRERAERMRVLYKLSRELSETPNIQQMFETARTRLEEFYGLPILILTTGLQGDLEVKAGDPTLFEWNENELSVARWVLDRVQIAGAGSDTLSGSRGLYLPMRGIKTTTGVLGIRPKDAKVFMDPERLQLLETFASEVGAALESTRMSEEIGRAEMQMEMQAIKNPATDARVRIGDFLAKERIVILKSDLSKEQILQELLRRLNLPNPSQAMQSVLGREKAGPTLIGESVAIPHARVAGLKHLQVSMGITAGNPVRVWLLFISPAEDPKLHLNFLASVSSFFQEPKRVDALIDLKSPRAVLDYIRQSEIPPS